MIPDIFRRPTGAPVDASHTLAPPRARVTTRVPSPLNSAPAPSSTGTAAATAGTAGPAARAAGRTGGTS
jgi:hypothetical protein